LCGGDNHSTSVHGDDDRIRIKVSVGNCRLTVKMRGKISFLPDETGVASMESGARLEIEERRGGVERSIVIKGGPGGEPMAEYAVNGRRQDLDQEGRDWLAFMVPQIFRMTGIQAEERVGRILAGGGVEAVFEEIRLIGGDYNQRRYLSHLLKQADLDVAQTAKWIDLAGREIGSDYELASALGELPTSMLTEPPVQSSFVEAARTIGSDYEMRRTLNLLLEQESLSASLLAPLLEAAGTIDSDYECAQLLVTIADRYPAGEALPTNYYEVAASIGSDYEMSRVLAKTAGREMDEQALGRVLEAAKDIGSDYELAELLVALLREHGLPESVRGDYQAALDTLGNGHERGRVLEAWHRAEGRR